MDQATLVDLQIADGQRLVDRLTAEGVTVTVAAWVKQSGGDIWFLYVASSLVREDEPKRPAYRWLRELIRRMEPEGVWIDPMEVTLLAPTDPIARALIAARNGHLAARPVWYTGGSLRAMEIDAAYIYPLPVAAR